MIQKILHFVWLGNNIPKYVNFSISAFKYANPDFNIHFISYGMQDIYRVESGIGIQTIDEQLLLNSIKSILNKNSEYGQLIQHCKRSKLKFIQILADIYRLELLQYYGGIYLDCDTFPVRPFDDILLQSHQFIVRRHYSDVCLVNDNYFMGYDRGSENPIIKEIFDADNTKNVNTYLATVPGWWKNIIFLKNKKRFFDCKLKYGEYSFSKEFYIDHYNALTWKDFSRNQVIQYCKFDNIHEF